MRKLTLTLAAAGAAIAFAASASAQYYPNPYQQHPNPYQQQPYGYQNGYGYGNGYNNYGPVQRLQMRVDSVQRYIQRLDRADRIRNRTADQLRREARSIERELRAASTYGLDPREARNVEYRLGRLEQRVNYAMTQRFGRNYGRQAGYYGAPGYNHGGYQGHDRDDNDDRWDGRRHDDDRDDD